MKTYCVISHTHWDREWYMPLESMKLRLCDLMDRCLEILKTQPEYIFHLDAQTIVLEDYLEIRPSRRAELERYISEGRLLVGPWYMQNDFYLTSGEATVRNLLEGTRLAKEFGKCTMAGYAPDQFGNPDQLPQILAQFGIDNFIFGRGCPGKREDGSVMPSEFLWEGADGTRALAIHMRYWYNNAQHFSHNIDKAKILIDTNGRLFEGVAATPYILMMNGVDHTEAQPDLLPVLEKLRPLLDEGVKVRQVKMDDYVDTVRAYFADKRDGMTVQRGELRLDDGVDMLKSTLSSRFVLKAANVKAQTMLENKLEPLYAMLELAGMEGAYSLEHFRYMWKQLMKNHPHDSICGCSRDEVHAHMEDNYARLETTTWDILHRGMKIAAEHLGTPGADADSYILAVANTTQREQDRVIDVIVDIPKADNAAGIAISDGQGRPAEFLVLSREDAVRDGFSPLNLPGNFPVDRYRISLRTGPVAPFAIKGFVVRGTAMVNAVEAGDTAGKTLENDAYKVTVHGDGRVDLMSKPDGRLFPDILDIEDTADRGDSYTYYSDGSAPIFGHDFPAAVETLRLDGLGGEIRITRDMVLPARFDFGAKRRSADTAVTRTELTLRLTAGTTPPEVTFTAHNQSCDHRLRLKVNTGIAADRTIADNPFDIVTRLDSDHVNDRAGIILPNATFAALEKDGRGLAVLTEGAQEYGRTDDAQALYFTLVRSTGVISRNHETMEPSGGDQWICPENQSLRTVSGRFALLPYDGAAALFVPHASTAFRAGLTAYYTSCDSTKFMKGRAAVQDTRLEEFYFLPDPYAGVVIPDNRSLLTVEGDGLLVTALKKTEAGDGFALRTVNLTAAAAGLAIQAPAAVYASDLMEQTGAPLGGKVDVRPKQIHTALLKK